MNMQRPSDTNFTPAAVAGALQVIKSSKLDDSSSDSLLKQIVLGQLDLFFYNLWL